jgi:hypothetical protein
VSTGSKLRCTPTLIAPVVSKPVSQDDLDVTEIRTEIRDFRNATTASFNALREDFGDLRTHVDRGFTEMRGKLDATASGQQHIADLIQRLIDDQDR